MLLKKLKKLAIFFIFGLIMPQAEKAISYHQTSLGVRVCRGGTRADLRLAVDERPGWVRAGRSAAHHRGHFPGSAGCIPAPRACLT